MLILGIESSCDDTSAALLDCSAKGCFVVNEKTASQIEIHKKYGGVVPEIAGRMHAEKIVPLIEEVLASPPARGGVRGGGRKPDAIAVTSGPGLITGLLVGVEAARALSYAWNVPLVGVNHIEGHIYSVEILNPKSEILNKKQTASYKLSRISGIPFAGQNTSYKIQYPALALIASGGHTELILIKKQGQYKILGATLDDAAGECFDKVAKMLGLPYPGGPQISQLAKTGNPKAINFPRPMLAQNNFQFSFAGLKTSALYWLRDNIVIPTVAERPTCHSRKSGNPDNRPTLDPRLHGDDKNRTITINDFCASFEQAIIDVLVGKTLRAAEKYKPKTIILGGGVSANRKLRETLNNEIKNRFPDSSFMIPNSSYCMDNAAMIAVAGYYRAAKKDFCPPTGDPLKGEKKLKADPNWRLAK